MDGSEEGNVLPAAVLSGAPVELQARTVRYGPLKEKLSRMCFVYTVAVYFVRQRRLVSRVTGMRTNGAWTGTF